MNTFKLTMPNGIIIESTWDDASTAKLALPKQPKAVKEDFAAEGSCPRCIAGYEFCSKHNPKPKASKVAPKAKVAPKGQVSKAKKPKASKVAKTDSKSLLAEIRALKVAGKYSEAVQLTPPSWLQVIGEIQLHAERCGNGVQHNAAVKVAKAASKKRSKAKRAAKLQPTAEKAEGLVGAIDMVPDTGSSKPVPLAPKVEAAVAAKASTRDQLADIGVADFAIDVLVGDISLKATREMYTTATEDEVLDLMEACRQEALLIEDAAERIETAKLSKHIIDSANGLVELWKAFSAKLNKIADAMTVTA